MELQQGENICPVSGLPIRAFPEWDDIELNDSYSVTFMLLGENMFLSIPVGNSDSQGMKRFISCRKEFLKYTGLYDKDHIELKDYSRLKGKIDKSSRLLFTEMLLGEERRGHLLGLLGYNGQPFIRWYFELGKKLYSKKFPLFLYKNYELAVSKALQLFKNRKLEKESVDVIDENEEINKLLYFINELSWDLKSSNLPDFDLEDSNPFKRLYQSLALIKSDYSDIIQNQKIAEENLQRSYKEIERIVEERTEKLKEQELKLIEKTNILETSLDILSHDTKNHFISLKYEINQIIDSKLKSSINESVEDIQALITEATGIMSSKKRIVSIVELIENIKVTSKRLPLMSHDRIEVEFLAPEFLFVQTSALFKNAISNLIENALKYTGENNKVKILVEKDHTIKVHIIDFGIGIPDGEKEKILEKFYRREATENIEGSGRGLWITNNIINQEEGNLTISDNPEGGTIFTINLPPYRVDDFDEMLRELATWFEMPYERVKTKAESYRTLYQLQGRDDIDHMDSAVFTTILTEIRKERKEEKNAFVTARLENFKNRNPDGKSIVIVDDSLYVQFYLAKYFTELGWNVLDFQDNGESAILSYKKKNPDYISLDNNMNVKTGPEAAEEIYEFDKDARVIFITALGDSILFKEKLIKKLPGKDYRIMTKPVYKRDVEKLSEEY